MVMCTWQLNQQRVMKLLRTSAAQTQTLDGDNMRLENHNISGAYMLAEPKLNTWAQHSHKQAQTTGST